MGKLSTQQILRIVNRYIGVQGGYLGDFSYKTHSDFYPDYCGINIEPEALPGTTRERFIKILEDVDPGTQAKILKGVLKRFPPDQVLPANASVDRFAIAEEIKGWISMLEGSSAAVNVDFKHSCQTVMRALEDAKILLQSPQGPISAVDRAHTAFHGYLRDLSESLGLEVSDKTTIVHMLKHVTSHHPSFTEKGHRSQDIERILDRMASILDALNPIRNRGSVAHPNPKLIDPPEAMLVINAVHTLMSYVQQRIDL